MVILALIALLPLVTFIVLWAVIKASIRSWPPTPQAASSGKLISPQNLAIAATAVGMDGQESVILFKEIGWSVACCWCCVSSSVALSVMP